MKRTVSCSAIIAILDADGLARGHGPCGHARPNMALLPTHPTSHCHLPAGTELPPCILVAAVIGSNHLTLLDAMCCLRSWAGFHFFENNLITEWLNVEAVAANPDSIATVWHFRRRKLWTSSIVKLRLLTKYYSGRQAVRLLLCP